MNNPKLSLVVAISKNRAIGKNNKLLWYIPEDMKRFKAITSGHPIIMGRKTFESIGRPLPDRLNIVISHDPVYSAPGCEKAGSLDEALELAKKQPTDEIFVIGGGQIFEQAMPLADRLYLTVIDAHVDDADTFFPEYPHFSKVLLEEDHVHDGLRFTFYELERS